MTTVNSTKFFDAFPKIQYDINKNKIYEETETATNIFFRIGIIRKIANNIASYESYTVTDGETPEIVAENNYGNANAAWIVLYANQIFDPQFDWPLGSYAFDNYIKEKYGSAEKALQTVHHVEKVVVRENLTWNTRTERRFTITPKRLTDYSPGVPFDYQVWDQNLVPYPEGPDPGLMIISGDSTQKYTDNSNRYLTVDMDTIRTEGGLSVQGIQEYTDFAGETIITTIRSDIITCYDYEYELNEAKRNIKLIKPRYYSQIMSEFNKLTENVPDFVRRLR